MTDLVNEFFHKHYPADWKTAEYEFTPMLGGMWRCPHGPAMFPRMVCADGFSMSVQAHYAAYSRPRDDFAENYTAVEVGFPSERDELLMPFVEDASTPTNTVYGYVPVSVVCDVITKHGGLAP